jgi:hypothetical protein
LALGTEVATQKSMQLELTNDEASFLKSQLSRHLEHVEGELARTDKHELQHALAQDASALRAILDRVGRIAQSKPTPDIV